ncbi:hypothetical protein TgHK011_005444 [Trichoderma gracile]|nr:hypothetical protein TgHK011_005444 [Trichoderma gracile]
MAAMEESEGEGRIVDYCRSGGRSTTTRLGSNESSPWTGGARIIKRAGGGLGRSSRAKRIQEQAKGQRRRELGIPARCWDGGGGRRAMGERMDQTDEEAWRTGLDWTGTGTGTAGPGIRSPRPGQGQARSVAPSRLWGEAKSALLRWQGLGRGHRAGGCSSSTAAGHHTASTSVNPTADHGLVSIRYLETQRYGRAPLSMRAAGGISGAGAPIVQAHISRWALRLCWFATVVVVNGDADAVGTAVYISGRFFGPRRGPGEQQLNQARLQTAERSSRKRKERESEGNGTLQGSCPAAFRFRFAPAMSSETRTGFPSRGISVPWGRQGTRAKESNETDSAAQQGLAQCKRSYMYPEMEPSHDSTERGASMALDLARDSVPGFD